MLNRFVASILDTEGTHLIGLLPVVALVGSSGAFCWTGGPGDTVSAHSSGDAHQTQKNL